MTDRESQLSRLASLLMGLSLALRRHDSETPEILRAVGQRGRHHIAMLVSLEMVGPGTVSELAARLDISRAHASLVTGELAKVGLVDRNHVPEDRRLIRLSLSAKAKPALAAEHRRRLGPLEQFLAELPTEEADQFIELLEKFSGKLRAA